MKKFFRSNGYTKLAIILAMSGIIILILTRVFERYFHCMLNLGLNEIGDWFGGILNPFFALAAFIMVIGSLKSQEKSAKANSFENILLNLISNYDSDLNKLKIKVEDAWSSKKEYKDYEGNIIFIKLFDSLSIKTGENCITNKSIEESLFKSDRDYF